jgi:citrate lyase subunit beta / citryl-CoA lyase
MTSRSLLFVPGDQPAMLQKALHRGADALIVDLEDAVAPTRKAKARELTATWLSESDSFEFECWVRVNGGTSMNDDLAALGALLRDGIMLPKGESAADVGAAVTAVTTVAPSAGVIVLVETAKALVVVNDIARVPGVRRLMLGEIDLGAELRMEPDLPAWDAVRVDVVVTSVAAGLEAPIAGIDPDFSDQARVEADTRRLAAMGFGGRAAIHPAQVAPINRAFIPTAEQVRIAAEALARHEAALTAGVGAYTDDRGHMVDEALLRRARRTLDDARRAGIDISG